MVGILERIRRAVDRLMAGIERGDSRSVLILILLAAGLAALAVASLR